MRSRRSRTALILASALALLLSLFAMSPASAAEVRKGPGAAANSTTMSCGQYAWAGDRLCYLTWASNGGVMYTILHVQTVNGHDRAWGEALVAAGGSVYFDVSRNGGSTWSGWVDTGSNGTGGWSTIYPLNSYYDGPGYWVRACATDYDGYFTCTPWN